MQAQHQLLLAKRSLVVMGAMQAAGVVQVMVEPGGVEDLEARAEEQEILLSKPHPQPRVIQVIVEQVVQVVTVAALVDQPTVHHSTH